MSKLRFRKCFRKIQKVKKRRDYESVFNSKTNIQKLKLKGHKCFKSKKNLSSVTVNQQQKILRNPVFLLQPFNAPVHSIGSASVFVSVKISVWEIRDLRFLSETFLWWQRKKSLGTVNFGDFDIWYLTRFNAAEILHPQNTVNWVFLRGCTFCNNINTEGVVRYSLAFSVEN